MQRFEDILQQIDNYEVELPENDWDILSQKIIQNRRKAFPMWWYAAAASVALLIGLGVVLFNFGTQNSPQVAQINTDNLIENQPENLTAKNTEVKQRVQKNNISDKNFAVADLQSVSATNAPITNRREQEKESEHIENQSTTTTNQQPKINNQQPKISIEEAERLMNASATLSDRNNASVPERSRRQINNNQQSTTDKHYFASISASASPTAFGKAVSPQKRMFIPSIKGDNAILSNINSEAKYDLPLTFAFTFGIPLVKRLYLNTGIQYTYIHSKIENFESDTRTLISRDNQELHYLGVPLMLSYRIVDKNIFKLYVSGGGVVEKGLLETHNIKVFNELNTESIIVPTDNKNRSIPGVQFSLNANIGASITLVKGLSLYAEPGLAWYIPATKYPQPISRRTKNPIFFSITAGLRFNFEK